MEFPMKEEIEVVFDTVHADWQAEAEMTVIPNDWNVNLYDASGDLRAWMRFGFVDNPPRLEWHSLTVGPPDQRTGFFTSLFPKLGPWLVRSGFEWIIIRDYPVAEPFLKRGFILRDDPAGDTSKQVLTIDLREENRPSLQWVQNG